MFIQNVLLKLFQHLKLESINYCHAELVSASPETLKQVQGDKEKKQVRDDRKQVQGDRKQVYGDKEKNKFGMTD